MSEQNFLLGSHFLKHRWWKGEIGVLRRLYFVFVLQRAATNVSPADIRNSKLIEIDGGLDVQVAVK